ncbi:unnamed protein product [Trichobilharzia regenti]|nr:unnamed protein product [Trichobilharzia regenti]
MTLLPMENGESFEQDKPSVIPPILEEYIKQISKNGQTSKIHQEDPRFPSRAGLDECGLLMDGPTISPPNSPSTENIRMHNASKSSDEEGTEEEDDDEGEDNSSDASDGRQSPKTDHNLKSTSLMNNSCASSWLFKAQNALNLPNTPPMPFRNASAPKARLTDQSLTNTPLLTGLCGSLMSVYSNNDDDDDDDDDCEQSIRSSENKPTSSDSQVIAPHLSSAASNLCSESSESLDTLPTESNREEISSSDSTHGCVAVENQIQDSSSSWCEGSRVPDLNVCTSEDLNSQYNSKLGEVCPSDLVISDAQSDLPIKGLLVSSSNILIVYSYDKCIH